MMKVPETDIGLIDIRNKTSIRLGRVPEDNDRVLPHPSVSALHARLEIRPDGTWWVVDLESDHGTYVNNQRVGQEGLPITVERDTLWIAPYALRLTANAESVKARPAHMRLDAVNLKRLVQGSRILLDLGGTPLSFRPGEFTAIVGGSGAGKSTLLKALLGMDTIPENGRMGVVYFNSQLLINDADIRSFAPLNTIIGYVPQQDDSMHFQLSAREALNYTTQLRYASDIASKDRYTRIKQALDAVKLDREELQTKSINQLSGGQRKRVNLAMELVADPRLLFLDEPTSGLDPGLDLEMMSLLKSWTTGTESNDPKTIILITHATENVRQCDYVVFMGRIKTDEEMRGGAVLYFGPPGDRAQEFFGKETFSEIYRLVDNPDNAGKYHAKLTSDPRWNQMIWDHGRTRQDIEESRSLESTRKVSKKTQSRFDFKKSFRQFKILAQRYWLLLRRDRGAFLFQLLQGVLVALLIWGVAEADTFTASGVTSAPTTLFIMSIAATWLGILNATKEIVKERRVFGRERRYGVGAIPYVVSKFAVLGGLGLWQVASLILITVWRFTPEHVGTFGSVLPAGIKLLIPLEVEWFISLELMLLAGVSLGLVISAFSRSLDQATMLMFPAMLIQVLLAGLLFDVGPLAWTSFSHWGLQALGNSLHLVDLFRQAGKANTPVLDDLNFNSNGFLLIGFWLVLLIISVGLTALACWRQNWRDKARIPED
jgi:ABC-type multidrug transport system ATPase subunit